ncbi:MAG: hypothetical protein CMM70_02495 [Rhodospirillaceae bacterium]|nr:hypothetical protein [Rhodospirillaceae bacterium]
MMSSSICHRCFSSVGVTERDLSRKRGSDILGSLFGLSGAAMSDVINLHDAKTHFSKLVDQVAATGKPVLIGKRGHAMVQLVPLPQDRTAPRPLGLFRASVKLL